MPWSRKTGLSSLSPLKTGIKGSLFATDKIACERPTREGLAIQFLARGPQNSAISSDSASARLYAPTGSASSVLQIVNVPSTPCRAKAQRWPWSWNTYKSIDSRMFDRR